VLQVVSKSLLTALGIWQSRDVDVEQCGNAVWQALTCKDSEVKKISVQHLPFTIQFA